MNVDTALRRKATLASESTAIMGPDATDWSYGDLDRRAGRVAAWLKEVGVEVGDRVVIHLPNAPAYFAGLFGCWRIGAVGVPMNARFGADELSHVATEVSPAALITADLFREEADAIRDGSGLSDGETVELVSDGSFELTALPDSDPGTEPRLDEEPAMVMYTLGRGAAPVGVVQTHRNVGAQMEATGRHFDLSTTDTAVVSLPLFHVGGLCAAALPLLFVGGTVALQPSWDAEGWAALTESTSATYTVLVPTMMVDAIETEEAHGYDTSSLEYCMYGGAEATEETLSQFESKFAISRLYNFYGQTETTGLAVTFDETCQREPGLLGRPSQAVRCRLVDVDSGQPVSDGEPGELLLRGDVVTPELWDAPDQTAERFTDGWLHTGDVVRRDSNEYLYYVDRVSDMIITGGENVSPRTVEAALREMPGVADVAVFGVEDERLGEKVTAAIVSDREDIDADEVGSYWHEEVSLADYQRPRQFIFPEELPRKEDGSVDHAALKANMGE